MGHPFEAPCLNHLAVIVVPLCRQFSPVWAAIFPCPGDSRCRLLSTQAKFFMPNLHIHGYDVGVDSWEQMGATSVQPDKVVNVRMSESEHTLLKAYCASFNRSMQDVLRDFALMQIQKQRFCCRLVRSLMDEHGIEQDPRARKLCFGYACYYCRHAESCMAGETDLLYIPRQEIRELVAEESAYIFDFDGSSIEVPTQMG